MEATVVEGTDTCDVFDAERIDARFDQRNFNRSQKKRYGYRPNAERDDRTEQEQISD